VEARLQVDGRQLLRQLLRVAGAAGVAALDEAGESLSLAGEAERVQGAQVSAASRSQLNR